MRKIKLNRDKVALVDDVDFAWLSKHKWCFDGDYARRHINIGKKRTTVSMHREIMQTPIGMDTDHINGDKLDNRRSNLRICTRSQNQMNRKVAKNSKTGHKGVSFHRWSNSYRAILYKEGKQVHQSNHKRLEDAIKAYSSAATEHHGKFAKVR